jgi:hypothetical protein
MKRRMFAASLALAVLAVVGLAGPARHSRRHALPDRQAVSMSASTFSADDWRSRDTVKSSINVWPADEAFDIRFSRRLGYQLRSPLGA